MPSIYDFGIKTGGLMDSFQKGQQEGRDRGLRSLMGDYAAGGAPDLRGIAANGGNPLAVRQDQQGQEDRKRKRVGEMATTLLSLPPHMRPAAYRQMAPEFPTLGIQGAPADYSDELEPLLQSVSTQFGGGAADTFKPMNVSPGGQVVDPRTGKVIHSNTNFAPMKPIWDSPRGGWVMPIDQQQGPTQAPAPQMTNAGGPAPPPGNNDAILATANQMVAAGIPNEYIEKWMSAQPGIGAPDAQQMPVGRQVGGGGVPAPMGGGGFIPVVPPKADAPRAAPAGYEWKPDRSGLVPIPGGPAQVAIDARQSAADAKQTAGQVRQAEAAGQASGLVAAIDRLTGSSGFGDLGSTWGDIERGVPFIRTDAKDADAQLKNIAGQVALTTMSRLKALSATGATGFGSLTAPELRLLENSLASLQAENISNKELRASLKIIRDSMQKIADWKEPASPAPASAGGGWAIKAVP